MIRKYERGIDDSFMEFESIDNTIIMRTGSKSGSVTEVLKKKFNDWKQADEFYNSLRNAKTTEGFFDRDALRSLESRLQYDKDAEDFMSFDLSSISFEEYEDELPTTGIITQIGKIDDQQHWLISYMTWLTIHGAFQEGIKKSLESKEFKLFSKRKPAWIVTAQEHGQLKCVIARIENGKLIQSSPGESFWCERSSDLYHAMDLFFLNGRLDYPEKIISEVFKNAIKTTYEKPDVADLIEDIRSSFVEYYEGGEEYDLINFEWYESGDPSERYASAYAFKTQKNEDDSEDHK